MQRPRTVLSLALAAAALLAQSPAARAQTYPARPITMIVPYAAAGLFDVLARVLAEPMRKVLGQSVVVENIGGANGSIAAGRLARSAPDGYTIGFGSGDQFVINGAIYLLQYDVVKDFEPLALLMNGPLIIVGKNSLPKGLKDLLPWLKANHATVAFAHNGGGGVLHLCGLAMQGAAGSTWPFIPYRGAAPALQDMIGGRVDVMCPSPASSLGMVSNGLIQAYAVTGSSRLAASPDVPTVAEAGSANLQVSVWGGMFAPKGVPQSVVTTLNGAIKEALADPTVAQKFVELGQDIFPRAQQTPEALAALQRADIEKWWPIIRAANIRGE